MSPLSLTDYDSAEERARSCIADGILEAFQSPGAADPACPARVRTEKELYRYIEQGDASSFADSFDSIIGGLTVQEFDLWQHIWAAAIQCTESNFGRLVLPRNSLTSSFNLLRYLRSLWGGRKPRIVEIGPGGGNFGAAAVADGHIYAGIESSQPYYVVQNRLWNCAFGNQIIETARSDDARQALCSMIPGVPVHVPWWHFAKLLPGEVRCADVVVCHAGIFDMHEWSTRYAFAFAREALRGNANDRKLLTIEGWNSASGGHEDRLGLLSSFGFELVHQDATVTIFAPSGSEDARSACGEAGVPVESAPTRDIVLGRMNSETKTIPRWQIEALGTALLGVADRRTDDERFFDVIGVKFDRELQPQAFHR